MPVGCFRQGGSLSSVQCSEGVLSEYDLVSISLDSLLYRPLCTCTDFAFADQVANFEPSKAARSSILLRQALKYASIGASFLPNMGQETVPFSVTLVQGIASFPILLSVFTSCYIFSLVCSQHFFRRLVHDPFELVSALLSPGTYEQHKSSNEIRYSLKKLDRWRIMA
jgi:hypothetical protein